MSDFDRDKLSTIEINLCKKLSVRYTISAFRIDNKPVNQITMYLHSTDLKKQIGKKVQTKYSFTKRELAKISKQDANDPIIPSTPTILTVEKSILKLLKSNAELDLKPDKIFKGKSISYSLNENTLAVFWLHNFNNISFKYWESDKQKAEAQKIMAHILINIGDFDLSRFKNISNTHEICQEIHQNIVDIVDNKDLLSKRKRSPHPFSGNVVKKNFKTDDVTKRTHEYSKVFFHVIKTYLMQISCPEIAKIQSTYLSEFRIKSSKTRGRSSNLISKTLTKKEYTELSDIIVNRSSFNDNLKAALLLMLFMGLTPEEICGINKSDCISIKNYSNIYSLQITKEYVKAKGNKKSHYLSSDLKDIYKYRNLPLPDKIYKLIKETGLKNVEYLFYDEYKHRLTPDKLNKEFRKLFTPRNEILTLTSETPTKTINLGFDPKHYIRSLESLWSLFGLHDSEIRYLLGRVQIETAAKHYIDFNNPHKKYAMFAHTNYVLDCMSNKNTPTIDSGVLFSNKNATITIDGVNNRSMHTRLKVLSPCKITIKNKLGYIIQKED